MRPLAISLLLVLLAAFFVTPTASGSEIPPVVCGPTSMCTEPELSICDSPDMCNDAGCPYPVGAEQGTTVGPIHVACGPQGLCSGPMRCTSPFDSAAVNIPPVCIWREAVAGPVKAGVDLCRESHETYPCFSPQRIHIYQQQGPVYAQVHFCFPHTPPPTFDTASNPGPCGGASSSDGLAQAQTNCPAPVPICSGLDTAELAAADTAIPGPQISYGIRDNCHVDVYVKWDIMDCLWGEQYNPTQVGPLVTVWIWGCSPPYPPYETMSAAPPCTCPPPRPLCYDVNRAVAWGDDVWMDDSCNVTVELEANCGLQGYDQHEERIGKVTLRYQTCQQPPVE